MSVVLEGRALHSGRAARVILARRAGPVTLRAGGEEARIDDLRVTNTDRATTVACSDGKVRVGTVEHLFAALAGARVYEGIAVDVDGDELPLLDGAALSWARAIVSLGVQRTLPRLVVARDGAIEVGSSVYAFRREGMEVGVRFQTADSRLAPDAAWAGDAGDFVRRIAPARTFAFARDVGDLAERGLASHISPESVVLIAEEAIHSAGAPFAADEPARHKLLDLIGDLYLYGGPPRGSIHATRPGHAATHTAIARALAAGILIQGGAKARGSAGIPRTE